MRCSACALVVLIGLPTPWARSQDQPSVEPAVLPKYALRFGGRAALADPELAESIRLALVWLRDHQAEDGRWDTDEFMNLDQSGTKSEDPGSPVHDIGITGLALLALLADGNTTTRGEFQESVRRGVGWLRAQQNSRGMFGATNSNEFIYSHLIASIAMSEAFGLSGDPELRGAAQAGVRFTEKFRNPDRAWRYQPQDGDNDVSVTVWAMSGLLAARDCGLEVDAKALADGDKYLADMTDEISGRTGYSASGGYSSRRRGEHGERFPREANETITGAALFVEYELGCDPEQRPVMARQIQRVLTCLPDWDPKAGSVDFYAWFHGSMAMRQAGGASWKEWSKALQNALVPHQRLDGHFAGSWDPVGPWGRDGGRIYATAMGALALSSWYRFAEIAKLLLLPDTAAFWTANSAWTDGRFDDLAAALDRLEEGKDIDPSTQIAIAAARRALESKVAGACAVVQPLEKSEDYVFARDTAIGVAKQFGRLEPGRLAEALLDRFKKDRRIQGELKAMDAYDDLLERYDYKIASQRRKLMDGLDRICKQYPGTRGANQASERLGQLRRMR